MNRGPICTCSPKLVLTKGTKVNQRKVSSARLIVYTAHFIRAGLDFQDRVPILSVLGLPLDMVRARVKFWSGTDGAKSFTRLNLSVLNLRILGALLKGLHRRFPNFNLTSIMVLPVPDSRWKVDQLWRVFVNFDFSFITNR